MVRSSRVQKTQPKKTKADSPAPEENVDNVNDKVLDMADKMKTDNEPVEKKMKVANDQENEADKTKESKNKRATNCRYKRLGISDDEAEKILQSDENGGRRTRSRSRVQTPEQSTRSRKLATPAKETKPAAKPGRKEKKAASAGDAAPAVADEEVKADGEKADEVKAEDAEPVEKEEAAAEDEVKEETADGEVKENDEHEKENDESKAEEADEEVKEEEKANEESSKEENAGTE
ncbi:Hypothetical predicted protein [Octopus vulgaris]|uniref:Uncharacterized protein n=2 Tax=Octopus TaxID=6643 RepID=A0AA36FAY0_OCTVU|nr:transcription factor iws-1 isoform X2 [Octopus sinensis]CAI9731195.1 Hypothetical predicted protein [Octopus vulgaris]